mmetsp:Transcript_20114/g.33010  ORF Transcript_20114/g.33010 Transcript_20114/m.33010 type:complete len:239 (-) Transcript_20114:450-1166(-)
MVCMTSPFRVVRVIKHLHIMECNDDAREIFKLANVNPQVGTSHLIMSEVRRDSDFLCVKDSANPIIPSYHVQKKGHPCSDPSGWIVLPAFQTSSEHIRRAPSLSLVNRTPIHIPHLRAVGWDCLDQNHRHPAQKLLWLGLIHTVSIPSSALQGQPKHIRPFTRWYIDIIRLLPRHLCLYDGAIQGPFIAPRVGLHYCRKECLWAEQIGQVGDLWQTGRRRILCPVCKLLHPLLQVRQP